jgi:hypothetical protein
MSRAGPALPKDLDRQVASDNSSSLRTMLSRRRLKLGEQGSSRETQGSRPSRGAPLYTSLYERTTTFPALCAATLGQVVVGEGDVTGDPLPASVRNLVLGRLSTTMRDV